MRMNPRDPRLHPVVVPNASSHIEAAVAAIMSAANGASPPKPPAEVVEATSEEIEAALKTGNFDHVEGKAKRDPSTPEPIDPRYRCFVHDKEAAIATALKAGKKGATIKFGDKTEHAILLNGQHVRTAKKLSKAERKAEKKRRRAVREAYPLSP
jgi:hypothetical protein